MAIPHSICTVAAPGGRPSRLTHSACAVLAALGLASAWPHAAQAQDGAVPRTGATALRDFNVPAGRLSTALAAFAADAGVSLSAAPALLEGRATAGLQGRHAVADGLQRLLAGTGLQAQPAGDGSYVLRAAPVPAAAGAASTVALPEVRVTAEAERSGASEGTRRYVSAAPLGTATPLGLTLQETPQSVSVITSQRLEDQGLTTVQQTLAQVPGVKTGTLGSELGNASARGYAITNYQFDGVNSFVEVLGGGAVPSSTLADMAFYDRVEVLRGASGLVTGVGEPSGTINMVRKKPTAEFQGSAEVGLGSWGDRRAVLDLAGPLNPAGTVRGRLIAVGQDADSYIDHYGRKKGQIYGVVEADLGSTTRLTAGLEHGRTQVKGQGAFVGFPLWYGNGTRTDLPVSFTAASRENWLDLASTKVFATLEQRLAGDWTLQLSGSGARSSHQEERTVLEFSSAFFDMAGDGVPLWASKRDGDIEHRNVDLNLRGPFTWMGRQHELVLGAAYEDYEQTIQSFGDTSGLGARAANLFTWDRTGAGVYGPANVHSRYDVRQSSLYGAARFQVSDALKLIAGLRVLSHDYRFAERWTGGSYGTSTSEDGVLTPYGGVLYTFGQRHTAYASYASIDKPQSARDRDGRVLDPVKGVNYELGIKSAWLDGRLNTAVALYRIQQDNLAVADPGYTVPGTVDTAASRAVQGARTEGLDVEVYGALGRDWNVAASWTTSQTKDAGGVRMNTSFPRQMVKLWTTWRLPGAWRQLTLGGGVNWQTRTYSSVNAWQIERDLYWEQKAYAVVNLMARYDFSDSLTATLNVGNVFDKKYINSVSDWWYSGNYGAPRSVALNLKYRF